MNEKLLDMLIRHEDLKLKPYRDSVGKLTIGIGRNLDDVGLTKEEAIFLCQNNIRECQVQLAIRFPWYSSLCEARQDVLVDMVFNLGMGGFLQFRKMIDALEYGHFEIAANEMIESQWARQVGQRSVDLYHMMMSGSY